MVGWLVRSLVCSRLNPLVLRVVHRGSRRLGGVAHSGHVDFPGAGFDPFLRHLLRHLDTVFVRRSRTGLNLHCRQRANTVRHITSSASTSSAIQVIVGWWCLDATDSSKASLSARTHAPWRGRQRHQECARRMPPECHRRSADTENEHTKRDLLGQSHHQLHFNESLNKDTVRSRPLALPTDQRTHARTHARTHPSVVQHDFPVVHHWLRVLQEDLQKTFGRNAQSLFICCCCCCC